MRSGGLAMSELTDEQAEELANFQPALTDEQAEEIEKACQRDRGINRRMLLALLRLDGKKLQEGVKEAPAATFDVFECGVGYLNRLRDLEELMDAACVRLMISLCVLDWDSEEVPFTEEQFGAVCSRLHRKSAEEVP